VRTAHEGPAALELARSFRPEIVILDIGLPGMNGYEIARQLRQESGFQEVLLIALTGYGQEDDRQRCEEVGFNYHLVKPVDPGVLRKLLSTVAGAPEKL
jgi:two-component system CheB/CheR fusion protein